MNKPVKFLNWAISLGLAFLLCFQLPGAGFSKSANAAMQFQITPFLSCVEPGATEGEIIAYFGYESLEAAVTQIIVGGDNRFIPPPNNRQQPILFFPGYHEKAFRVRFSPPAINWIFNGQSVIVLPTSPRCAPVQQKVAEIVPFVESITVNNGTATVSFGYQNSSSNTITLAAGTLDNRLSRTSNQTQPTEFLPGLQRNVYSTTFPASESLYWMVQGLPALAVPGTCPTITVRVR